MSERNGGLGGKFQIKQDRLVRMEGGGFLKKMTRQRGPGSGGLEKMYGVYTFRSG